MNTQIEFGNHTQISLDTGCGVPSFDSYLISRNVFNIFSMLANSTRTSNIRSTWLQFSDHSSTFKN